MYISLVREDCTTNMCLIATTLNRSWKEKDRIILVDVPLFCCIQNGLSKVLELAPKHTIKFRFITDLNT